MVERERVQRLGGDGNGSPAESSLLSLSISFVHDGCVLGGSAVRFQTPNGKPVPGGVGRFDWRRDGRSRAELEACPSELPIRPPTEMVKEMEQHGIDEKINDHGGVVVRWCI